VSAACGRWPACWTHDALSEERQTLAFRGAGIARNRAVARGRALCTKAQESQRQVSCFFALRPSGQARAGVSSIPKLQRKRNAGSGSGIRAMCKTRWQLRNFSCSTTPGLPLLKFVISLSCDFTDLQIFACVVLRTSVLKLQNYKHNDVRIFNIAHTPGCKSRLPVWCDLKGFSLPRIVVL
jgi:hypothetical protein